MQKILRWVSKTRKDLGADEFYLRVFTLFIIAALLTFLVISILFQRTESLYYIIIILPVIAVTSFLQKRLRIPGTIFVLVTLLFVFHVLGGAVYINDVRLYDMEFFGIGFDNYVHFYGSFASSFLVYNLILPYIKPTKKWYDVYLQLILILMTAGLGTLVEVVEFSGVVLVAADGVGDYANNALDLVVNLLGAIVGSFVIMQYHRKGKLL